MAAIITCAYELKHAVKEKWPKTATRKAKTETHKIELLKGTLSGGSYKVYSGRLTADEDHDYLKIDLSSFVNSIGAADTFNGLCIRQFVASTPSTNQGTVETVEDTSEKPVDLLNALGLLMYPGTGVQLEFPATELSVSANARHVTFEFSDTGDSLDFVVVAGPAAS